MLKRICDFCEKGNPNYTFQCRKTYLKFVPYLKWQSVDICEECYNKLFPKAKIEPPKAISAER